MDDVLGDRDAGEAAPPRYHSAHASGVWSRIGASEPAAQPAKAAAPVSHAPAARVNAAGELPGLVVADGVCTVDGEEEAPDTEALFDHVIGHLDRLDAELDARADELEARARRLEELQEDNFREQRRRALAAQDAGLTGALNRAADQTRRATEQLSAVMADGINSVVVTAPAPIQQLARGMDRAMAPIGDAARDLFGIKLTRITGLKGGPRRVYGDEVKDGEPGVSMGGDNFLGQLRLGEHLAAEPGDARFDDKNCETSVRRATGGGVSAPPTARSTPAGTQPSSPASTRHGSPAGSAPGSPVSRKSAASAFSASALKPAANPRATAAV